MIPGRLTELLDAIRREGIPVDVRDHVRVERLLAQQVDWSEALLRDALRSLLVRDAADLARFDAAFTRYFHASEPLSPLPPPAKPPWPLVWSVVLAFAALLAGVFFATRPPPRSPQNPRVISAPPTDPGVATPPTQVDRPVMAPAPRAQTYVFERGERVEAGPLRPRPGFLRSLCYAVGGGAALMVALALAVWLAVRRRRRRPMLGPWRYAWRPEAGAHPITVTTLEDVATALTPPSEEAADAVDVPRSVEASITSGGAPVLVRAHDRQTRRAAMRHAVLVDRESAEGPAGSVIEALITGLRRRGVVLLRYDFTRVPSRLAGDDGRAFTTLDALAQEVDVLVVVGSADAAWDAVRGDTASWVVGLQRFPLRVWVNPLPASRWSAGAARVVTAGTPMRPLSWVALREDLFATDRALPPLRSALDEPVDLQALREGLGDDATKLLSLVAVAGEPDVLRARWMARRFLPTLTDDALLSVLTLPWFAAGRWPASIDGPLGDRLRAWLRSRDEALAREAHEAVLAALAEDAPRLPEASMARALWRVERARHQVALGDSRAREGRRTLRALSGTALRGALRAQERARPWWSWRAGVPLGALAVALLGGGAVAALERWGLETSQLRVRTLRWRVSPLPAPPAHEPQDARCPAGMVYVPAGEFLMGSSAHDTLASGDERPQHRVRMSAFCIDRTEVTVAQYRACARCATPGVGKECNWGRSSRDDHPVNCVDWSQARAFCRASRKALPTEAQWEYAARGADGRIYPWGADPPTALHANLCGAECAHGRARWSATPDFGDDGYPETAPAGRFPRGISPFGVSDMIGNVWEWTVDHGLDRRSLGGSSDPRGRVEGSWGTLRGGSWVIGTPRHTRAAYSLRYGRFYMEADTGFRCVRDEQPPPETVPQVAH